MKNIITAASVVLASFIPLLYSQDLERFAPKVLPPKPATTTVDKDLPAASEGRDAHVTLGTLKGLVFISNPADAKARVANQIRGVSASGLPLLQMPEFEQRMEPWLGKSFDMHSLNELLRAVVTFYAENDRPYVNVALPEQEITSGVVQIVVVEGRVEDVNVKGNKWFSAQSYRDSVTLRPGDPLRRSKIKADTDFINQNPFRSADVYLAPGREPGTTDVTIQARDRFPLRGYVGYDNHGTKSTNENEFFAGFNYGNLFGLGHLLNYQYTTSPDFEQVQAHSGSYVAPLPWGHTFTLLGLYTTSVPAITRPFSEKGVSWQISPRYTIPLPPAGTYSQSIGLGYDFKSTNNNLDFGSSRVFNTTVDISQFVINYTASLPDAYGSSSLDANLVLSPGKMTGNNTDDAFDAGTPRSKAKYAYIHVALDRVTGLPHDFLLYSKFTFQLASNTLFSSETLGAGGSDSVRGYASREANGDDGILMTQEIRSPEMHLARILKIPFEDNLQFLGFWDLGVVTLKHPSEGQDPNYTLTSIGLGLRYSINPYFTLRADYGWLLKDSKIDSGFDSRATFSATLSY